MTDTDARPVRGRLAPSPTGLLHLGNAWAFLLAWLAARAAGGTVILRLEDIDPERTRPELAAGILRDLDWLGLDWDETAPPQSARLERYTQVLADLAARGLAYPCFCTRKELRQLASAPHAGDGSPIYPGTCRNLAPGAVQALLAQGRRPALRLRCPDRDEPIAFDDAIAGPQAMTLAESGGDFALRRSDGVFAYQLAVSVDDLDLGVTLVVRGDDILPSTARQIHLLRLLGGTPPRYAHLPLLLDHQGERLAKRHASLSLAGLREAGVSPAAVAGHLGWLAGLLPEPAPARPAALVPGFRLDALPRAPVTLPEDIAARLLALG